ncbi:MAG: hypothetical protein K6B28_01450 [Lachnospiraceae bacterium]|nr:hypothetical protein [Lachnospiraceae bacterium]
MKKRFNSFMNGRNGPDELGTASFITGTLIYFFGAIVKKRYILAAGAAIFCYGLFRMLSGNTESRSKENRTFINYLELLRKYLMVLRLQIRFRDSYRFLICRRCGQIIRIPKCKGRIEIICPRCKNMFIRNI